MSKENLCEDEKEETKSVESPKLFNDFNISSFNISFNAGKQIKEAKDVQKASKKKFSVLKRLANRHDSRWSFHETIYSHFMIFLFFFSSTDNGIQIRRVGANDIGVPNKVKNNSEESSATNIRRESAIVFSSPTPR